MQRLHSRTILDLLPSRLISSRSRKTRRLPKTFKAWAWEGLSRVLDYLTIVNCPKPSEFQNPLELCSFPLLSLLLSPRQL